MIFVLFGLILAVTLFCIATMKRKLTYGQFVISLFCAILASFAGMIMGWMAQ